MINFTRQGSLLLRKPSPQDFIRTLETEDDIFVKCVFDSNNSQAYIVHPKLWDALSADVTVFQLYPYINRNQEITLWPVKVILQTSRRDTWIMSAHKMAEDALNNWIRVIPNQTKRRYESIMVDGVKPFDTSIFEQSNQKILEQINDDLIISSQSHPLVKKLRGTDL